MAPRKPGKYDHLLHKFKKMPPSYLKQQERINLRKISLRECPNCDGSGSVDLLSGGELCDLCLGTGEWELTATRLAALYVIARADVATIMAAAAMASVELEALTQLLIDSQEDKAPEWGAFGASDRGMKLTNGDALRVQPELHGTVKNKAAFRQWCFDNGQTTHMELPEKKTQDLVKLRLLNGQLDPDGIEVFTRARIVYTPLKMEGTPATSDDDTQAF